MILVNALNSFVKFFTYPGVFSEGAFLPVALDGDLKFQLKMQGTESEMDDVMDADITINVVNNTGTINSDASMTANTIIPGTLFFLKYRLNATNVLLYWPHGLPGITAVSLETCFRLAFKIASSFYSTWSYIMVENDKYSSTLEYSCNENAYGFDFCADSAIVNKVRLPLYISKPQFLDDENIYIKSNGEIQVLSSVTKREFLGKTDYLAGDVHGGIQVALNHDNVTIVNHYYTGGIRKNGNYEITWPEGMEDEYGVAEFKVYATPYNVRNSNCEECPE